VASVIRFSVLCLLLYSRFHRYNIIVVNVIELMVD